MSRIMKRFLIIVFTSVLIISVFALFQHSKLQAIEKKEYQEYDINIENFIELDVQEVNEKIERNEYFLLYTGRKTCPYCRDLVSLLVNFLEEKDYTNIEIFYLDSQETETNIEIKNFRNKYDIEYVPSLIFFEGKDYSTLKLDSIDEKYDVIKLKKELNKYVNN